MESYGSKEADRPVVCTVRGVRYEVQEHTARWIERFLQDSQTQLQGARNAGVGLWV